MAGNSESVKKSNETMKRKYGPVFQARNGARGGRKKGRGYFGKLKDEGKLDELKALSETAAKERWSKDPKHNRESEDESGTAKADL